MLCLAPLPFTATATTLLQRFDLMMCHAVLEWLSEPEAAIAVLDKLLAERVGCH